MSTQDPGLKAGPVRRWSWLKGLFAAKPGDDLREALEDLIGDLSNSDPEDAGRPLSDREEVLLRNVLELRDMTVTDCMVPRAEIAAIDLDQPLAAALEVMIKEKHSRYPVYRADLDDLLGFVHIKDVFQALARGQAVDLVKLKRESLIVAPSLPILDLLLEMRARRTHMAMVVDEFGGIDGLVTIEDVIEQIVGEIQDEHDVAGEPEMKREADGTLLADARVEVEALERRLGLDLLDDDRREEIDTLGGLVFDLAGEVPSRGALVQHPSGMVFEVIEADARRIRKLRIRNIPISAEGPSG